MPSSFDIAFRSGDEPQNPSRADFFTRSILNSKRGYRALSQGKVPLENLIKTSVWHNDISATLNHFGVATGGPPQELVEDLRRYDLSESSQAVMEAELDASEQLALDLALSKDIFSSRRFIGTITSEVDAVESMSLATKALSLGSEPPPIQFGYLRPVEKGDLNDNQNVDGDAVTKLTEDLGVRLLLQDWQLGANPDLYIYEDLYGAPETTPSGPLRRPTAQQPPKGSTNVVIGPTVRPPAVVASSALRSATAQREGLLRTMVAGQSQPAPFSGTPAIIGSQRPPIRHGPSQDAVSSTQVLPGPHGGRPGVKKKRVGGF